MFAGRLDGATADGVTRLAKQVVAHTPAIVEEIKNRLAHGVRQEVSSGVESADVAQDMGEAALDQQLFLGGDPRGRLL